jgi:phosphatidylserine/phosphatidylglycerophosphate/cardiolipin synthase-like enzyme
MTKLPIKILLLALLACAPLAATHYENLACDLYFSPDDQPAEQLIKAIKEEKTSIYIAVYCLTHRGIVQALIDAKNRNVAIEIIVDPFSRVAAKVLDKLIEAKIPVYLWKPKVKEGSRTPLMHDKFCVFGAQSVWTGSFNFTYDANARNQENALLIHNPALAARYKEQFQRIKERGCTPLAAN